MTEDEKSKSSASPQTDHVHDYWGRTSTELDHFHTFDGTTGLQHYIDSDHVHRYATQTSMAHGHTHRMEGNTGKEIPTFAGHVHQIQGLTSYDEGHAHTYDVATTGPRRPRTGRQWTPEAKFSKESGSKKSKGFGLFSKKSRSAT